MEISNCRRHGTRVLNVTNARLYTTFDMALEFDKIFFRIGQIETYCAGL